MLFSSSATLNEYFFFCNYVRGLNIIQIRENDFFFELKIAMQCLKHFYFQNLRLKNYNN